MYDMVQPHNVLVKIFNIICCTIVYCISSSSKMNKEYRFSLSLLNAISVIWEIKIPMLFVMLEEKVQ